MLVQWQTKYVLLASRSTNITPCSCCLGAIRKMLSLHLWRWYSTVWMLGVFQAVFCPVPPILACTCLFCWQHGLSQGLSLRLTAAKNGRHCEGGPLTASPASSTNWNFFDNQGWYREKRADGWTGRIDPVACPPTGIKSHQTRDAPYPCWSKAGPPSWTAAQPWTSTDSTLLGNHSQCMWPLSTIFYGVSFFLLSTTEQSATWIIQFSTFFAVYPIY